VVITHYATKICCSKTLSLRHCSCVYVLVPEFKIDAWTRVARGVTTVTLELPCETHMRTFTSAINHSCIPSVQKPAISLCHSSAMHTHT